MPAHEAASPTTLVVGIGLLLVMFGYAVAVIVATEAGRSWPWWRSACALAGGVAGLVAVGPLGRAGHDDFVGHMWGHLLLGMACPLLLVLSAPATAVLRALPVGAARRLSAVLGSRYLQVVGHPVVAAVLNAGGLWLLYATSLHGWMHDPMGNLAVHVHVLLAGWLFTAAILQVDPTPHPHSHRLRTVVLVAFMASHGLLTKYIFANPPLGVPRPDAERGAQLMYVGGDCIDLVLIVAFCWDWYRRTAPRATRPALA